jgi:hypothetical protein
MAASTSPVFQKEFSLDPEILGPGSSLALEVGGSTDADVLLAIANNQPFPPRPAGVTDLAHISLRLQELIRLHFRAATRR